jgi:hypothetical protein
MTTLQIKVNKALEKIGVANGTNPPDSQDALDKAAHMYGVAAVGASFFDKAKKQAKINLEQAFGEAAKTKLKKAMDRVAKTEVKEDLELGRGQVYAVQAEIKNGASFLDIDALRVELMTKMKTDDVMALFERHTKRRDPSLSFKVVESSE